MSTAMVISKPYQEIVNCLHQGNLGAAKEYWLLWRPETDQEKLQHLLCESKILLYEGSFSKALKILQQCEAIDSDNLDTLCDIAVCYYQLGMHFELRSSLTKCHELYNQGPYEDIQKQLNHGILIAKLMTEFGLHLDAKKILTSCSKISLSKSQSKALKIQLLRIHVEIQESSTARHLYEEVLSGRDHNLDFEIEREHILLLADSFLINFQTAKERFSYLSKQNLTPADLQFLQSEMIELSILHQDFDFLRSIDFHSNGDNIYENVQADLIHQWQQSGDSPELSIIQIEKRLSLLPLLRLLRQALLLFPSDPQAKEWKSRYRFHAMSLSHRNLRNLFMRSSNLTEHSASVNYRTRTLHVQGREFTTDSPLFWQLLRIFSSNGSEIEVDKAIFIIYQEHPNIQHFDRLRIGISRLNKTLGMNLHCGPFFKITKLTIQLLVSLEEVPS